MALGTGTFSNIGGAVSDLFAGEGLRTRAAGARKEADLYDLSAGFARQNVEFTKQSTEIQQMQQARKDTLLLGGQRSDVAAAGFSESGSAIDLLRDSASQAALHKAVLGQQGLITEAGYDEQAKSYDVMSSAARMAASADETAAEGSDISAIIHGVAAVASVVAAPFTGGASLALLPAIGGASGAGVGGAAS